MSLHAAAPRWPPKAPEPEDVKAGWIACRRAHRADRSPSCSSASAWSSSCARRRPPRTPASTATTTDEAEPEEARCGRHEHARTPTTASRTPPPEARRPKRSLRSTVDAREAGARCSAHGRSAGGRPGALSCSTASPGPSCPRCGRPGTATTSTPSTSPWAWRWSRCWSRPPSADALGPERRGRRGRARLGAWSGWYGAPAAGVPPAGGGQRGDAGDGAAPGDGDAPRAAPPTQPAGTATAAAVDRTGARSCPCSWSR